MNSIITSFHRKKMNHHQKSYDFTLNHDSYHILLAEIQNFLKKVPEMTNNTLVHVIYKHL